ncbi:MAG: hypothetical protein AAF335_04345 [Bacteroidota bacterium]
MFRKCLYLIGFSLCPLSLVNASQSVDLNFTLTDATRTLLVRGYHQQAFRQKDSPLPKEIETFIIHYIRPSQDPRQWQRLFRFKVDHPLTSIDYHPGGGSLAFVTEKRKIGVLDRKTFQLIHTWKPKYEVSCIKFNPDGTHVAFGDVKNTLHIWYPKKNKHLSKNIYKNGTFSGISYGKNDVLFINCQKFTIAICQLLDKEIKILQCFNPAQGIVNYCKCSPDKNYLAVAGQDGATIIWNIKNPKRLKHFLTIDGDKKSVQKLSWHPSGKKLATTSLNGSVFIWELDFAQATCKLLQKFPSIVLFSGKAKYSPQGRYLAYDGQKTKTHLYDSEKEEDFILLEDSVTSDNLVWCPNGHGIATTYGERESLIEDWQEQFKDESGEIEEKGETIKHSIDFYCSPWAPVLINL